MCLALMLGIVFANSTNNVYVEGGRGKKGGIEIGGFAIFRFAVEKKTFTDLGVALKKGFTAMGNGIKTACRAIGNFFKTLGAKIKALFTKKK